jgi:hypothetical protein
VVKATTITGVATHPDASRSENYFEGAVLDAEAGAAGMSVVITTPDSWHLDLIVVPITGDVFGRAAP